MLKHKLVIVDDDAAICESLSQVLIHNGYYVGTELTAEAGLRLVKKTCPICVIVDIKLASTNGLDLLLEIKKFDRRISVIMMTGYVTLTSALEAMRYGASNYLTKPVSLDLLLTVLKKSIDAPLGCI